MISSERKIKSNAMRCTRITRHGKTVGGNITMAITRTEANKKFCEQFTYLKNSRDLSYRDIERGADVPHSCISHWLSGKGLPNGFAIMKLCDFFGVTADYLLGRC